MPIFGAEQRGEPVPGTQGAQTTQGTQAVGSKTGAATDAPPAPAGAKSQAQLRSEIQAAAAQIRANAAQIAAQARQTGTAVPPGISRLNNDIPPEAMEITKMFFTTVVLLAIGVPLIRAWIRRFDRRSDQLKAGPQTNLEPQLRQLQDSIDGLTLEVERIAEGQRFMAKVIGDREKVPASLPNSK